jgi:striatin 1/3/4
MSESSIEYTLPGVLHFLQAEWRKFEREKNEWVIERAELKVFLISILHKLSLILIFSRV